MSELPPGFELDHTEQALPTGFVLDTPSAGEDAAKSVAAGLGNATIGTLGGLGDVRSLASHAVDALGKKVGFDPSGVKSAISHVADLTPFGAAINAAPTSADVRATVTDPIVDPDYEPKTGLGGVLKTGAEFLPGMADPELAGPGALKAAAKLFATRVAAPALASEGAGELTKGTAAEPYVRAGAALLAGAAVPAGVQKFQDMVAASKAAKLIPAAADIKAASRAAYQSPDVAAVQIHPDAVSDLADTINSDLQQGANSGFRPANEPKVFNAVDELNTAKNEGRPASVADLDNVRQVLGGLAKEKDAIGQPTRQSVAASRAMGHIDDFLPNLKQSDLLAGDATKANSVLDEARSNWAAYKNASQVKNLASNAELNAASSHSGANIQNATKQAFKPLLKNNAGKVASWSPEEKDALNSIVRGTWTGHAARAAGNVLGGGGGLGMLLGAGAGYEGGGVPGAIAGAAAGRAFKMIGNRSTLNAVSNLDNLIRSRSPAALKIAAQNPQAVQALPQKSIQTLRAMIAFDPTLRPLNQPSSAVSQPDSQ